MWSVVSSTTFWLAVLVLWTIVSAYVIERLMRTIRERDLVIAQRGETIQWRDKYISELEGRLGKRWTKNSADCAIGANAQLTEAERAEAVRRDIGDATGWS